MTEQPFQYPPGVDRDQYDLQTYLEAGTEEAMAVGRRLDERAVAAFRARQGEHERGEQP